MVVVLVDVCDHVYKRVEVRQDDISHAVSHCSVKDCEQYKMSVGEIRGLSCAKDESKALLNGYVNDVEDTLSS